MKKTLPLLSLLLFAASFASAQLLNLTPGPQPWTCDNTSRLDNQGNPCVNFTTAPHPYRQATDNTMNWDTQDGKPVGTFTLGAQQIQEFGSVYTSYGQLQTISIADDPLKTVAYPPLNALFVNGYGWPSTTLDGFTAQEMIVANLDGSQDVTYVFTAQQNEDASFFQFLGVDEPWCFGGQCLTFQWQGTFTVHQPRVTLGCSGHAGHKPCHGFSTGVGKGEMSAIPVLQ